MFTVHFVHLCGGEEGWPRSATPTNARRPHGKRMLGMSITNFLHICCDVYLQLVSVVICLQKRATREIQRTQSLHRIVRCILGSITDAYVEQSETEGNTPCGTIRTHLSACNNTGADVSEPNGQPNQ